MVDGVGRRAEFGRRTRLDGDLQLEGDLHGGTAAVIRGLDVVVPPNGAGGEMGVAERLDVAAPAAVMPSIPCPSDNRFATNTTGPLTLANASRAPRTSRIGIRLV